VGTVILLTAFLIQRTLPRKESSGRAALPPAALVWRSGMPTLAHLSNPRLLGNVSGRVLACYRRCWICSPIASFHLAAPPFSLSPGVLGMIFIVYLVGGTISPTAGRAIDRYGQPQGGGGGSHGDYYRRVIYAGAGFVGGGTGA